MPKYKLTKLNVNLPFGIGGMSLDLNEAQIRAAWELYVEVATRISTQPLEFGAGSVREALGSLHALFEVTRKVLRTHGPGIGQGPDSMGPLAIRLLNEGVRPFLVKWHTKLMAHENVETFRQQQEIGAQHQYVIDESAWDDYAAFYEELEVLRKDLLQYVNALAALAGVTTAHEVVEADD